MENLPVYIPLVMTLTIILTASLLFRAAEYNRTTIWLLTSWLILQGFVSFTGFYIKCDTLPPRFALVVAPALLTIILVFLLPAGRRWLDTLHQERLVLLHVVRIPVEFVLLWLALYKTIPVMLSFEGSNLDIISGLTAPIVWYYGYRRKTLKRSVLIAWNFVCLALLLNVVICGALSVPTPIQQLNFDQPNMAMLYFPYALLPGFVVPAVLFSHLVVLRKLFNTGTP